jgi:hypothetical protein
MQPALRTPGALPPRDRASTVTPAPGPSARSRLGLILLPASFVLWVIGILTTNTASLGPYGLITALSPAFLLGLALLVISIGIEFAQPRLSEIRLGLHSAALVVMLYGTGALVYSDGRYAWLYKTIGVVQYVDAHGSLDRSIDIYQNWPGFFALAAWFDKVAGVSSPLDYAKWAQVAFELAAIPLLHTIYRAFALRPWHRWVAVMLYSASNWIGQDYFSPQGISTLLSLGVMAIAARWLFVLVAEKNQQRVRRNPARARPARPTVPRWRRVLPFIAAILVLFFALTASHELTPYIVTSQITILAVCGIARPRWVAAAVAGITIAYLVPNFTYVNNHFGIIASIGSFFRNVKPPSANAGYPYLPLPKSTKILNYCADALSAGIWVLALVGAWLRRKSRRVVVTLLLLTFSPTLVLAGGAYGNEGVLRVYLFSLPWAAALAACALYPVRPKRDTASPSLFRVVVPLALAISLFFPAFYGYDAENVMTSDEVNTLVSFQQTAKPGVVLIPFENLPFSDTAQYDKWRLGAIYGSYGIIQGPVTGDLAAYVARTVVVELGNTPAYIVVTPSMLAYNRANAVTFPSNLTGLISQLEKSAYWRRTVSHDGTMVFALTANGEDIPAGPYSKIVVAEVP